MKYLSVCSGIESASVAWGSLGWTAVAFSEIDPFASAVLHERFGAGRPWHMPSLNDPGLSKEERDERRLALKEVSRLPLKAEGLANWGDMTKFNEWPDVSIDLICGGTPCQSFSIAGLRKGLDDPRGNLMLTFGHILGKYRPSWFIWENVPGVLSCDKGRDFASFLGLVTGQVIEPPEDGWRNTGFLSGIDSAYGIAWRVLDAQYTRSPKHPRAVPQRRRRVFVVGHLGDWRRAAAVLLDSESVSRNPAPRREAGKRVAGTLKGGSGERGYPDPSDGNGGGLVEVAPTMMAGSPNSGKGHGARSGRSKDQLIIPVVTVYENHAQDSRITELDGVCTTVHAKYGMGGGNVPLVVHTLSADGFDASEDGTGRGMPIIVAARQTPFGEYEVDGTSSTVQARDYKDATDLVVLGGLQDHQTPRMDGVVPCLPSAMGEGGGHIPIVAIRTAQTSANGHGIAEEVAHTLDGANGQAVTSLALRQREGKPGGGKGPLIFDEHSGTLATNNDQTVMTPQMAVRRLVPTECEKLQGFEPGHTNVPYRSKTTSPDGQRYKSLGNSMATNCMEWIGERIIELIKLTPTNDRA